MIRAIFVVTVLGVYLLVIGLPLLLYVLLIRKTDLLHAWGKRGVKLGLWLAGVRLDVRGLEKIPRDRAVVFMANHQGNAEPPAIFALVPPILVLAKKEFFRIPILGRAMKLRGFVPVDRKNRERAMEAVEEAVEKVKAGHSFLVFPEGTRSPDGRLLPFKKGMFILAIQGGAPIVPISVSGSAKIMRKGEFAIHPGVLRITFQDPVPTEGFALDDRYRLMWTVRRAILAGLAPEEWPQD